MSELKQEVKTYMVKKQCSCGGFFEYKSNLALSTYPPLYPHTCDICGRTEAFYCIYPKIEYEFIDNEKEN